MRASVINSLHRMWQRFRRWQKAPLTYDYDSSKRNHCANCDHDFKGNYCPYCSQKQGVGRIGWNTVREGLMEVWGLHSRSMIYSLWQLLFRPGFFINDYINGRRQISFPPVKMLVIISIISVFVDHITVKEHIKEKVIEAFTHDRYDFINPLLVWFHSNPGWGWLCLNMFLLIPIWLLFHKSPRNYNHTLPQGFFILVFLSLLALIYDNIADCSFSFIYSIIPISYFFALKQLFGYSIWGTIWRLIIVFASGLMMALATATFYDIIFNKSQEHLEDILAILAINVVILLVGTLFDWHNKPNRENKEKTDNMNTEIQTNNNSVYSEQQPESNKPESKPILSQQEQI